MQYTHKVTLKDCMRYAFFAGGCVTVGWLTGITMLAFTLSLLVILFDLILQIHTQFTRTRQEKIGLTAPPTRRQDNPLIKNHALDETVFFLQYNAHLQRHNTHKTANELLQMYRLLNRLSYGLVITDKEGTIHWANKYARRLFGLKKSDLHSIITMFVRNPDFVRFFENRHYNLPSVFTYSGKKTATVEVERLEHGTKQDILLFRNITQQEQSQQMHRRFLADASHEIQSPLTIIRSSTELAMEKTKAGPKKHLQEVLHQVDNMSGLVRNLMILARIDENKTPDATRWFNPSKTIRLAGQQAASELGLEKKPINYQLDANLELWFNQQDLFIIARNLISNALKYTSSKQAIEVLWYLGRWDGAKEKKQYAIFAVRDFGPGIDEEQIQQLGRRFYRLTSSRTKTGHGLGISIVKGILRLYKGRLVIQSTPGKGSIFCCTMNKKYARNTDQREPAPNSEYAN